MSEFSLHNFFSSTACNDEDLHEFLLTSFPTKAHFLKNNRALSAASFEKVYLIFKKQPSSEMVLREFVALQVRSSWSFEKFMCLLRLENSSKVKNSIPYWFLTVAQADCLFAFFDSKKVKGVWSARRFSLFSGIVLCLLKDHILPVESLRKAMAFLPQVDTSLTGVRASNAKARRDAFMGAVVDSFIFKGADYATLELFASSFPDFDWFTGTGMYFFASVDDSLVKLALKFNNVSLSAAAASSFYLSDLDAMRLFQQAFFLKNPSAVYSSLRFNPVVSASVKEKVKLRMSFSSPVMQSASSLLLLASLSFSSRNLVWFADLFAKQEKAGVAFSSHELAAVKSFDYKLRSAVRKITRLQSGESGCLMLDIFKQKAALVLDEDTVRSIFSASSGSSSVVSYQTVPKEVVAFFKDLYFLKVDASPLEVQTLLLKEFCAFNTSRWELLFSLFDASAFTVGEFCTLVLSLEKS